MPYTISQSDVDKLPPGIDVGLITRERRPVKGEACWGFAMNNGNKFLRAIVMGELTSCIEIPALVFVWPNPGEFRLFRPVTWDDIHEEMARTDTDAPSVGEPSMGWTIFFADLTDGLNKAQVWKGPGIAKSVLTGVELEMVRPFKRDDPRHLHHWSELFWRIFDQRPDPAVDSLQEMLEGLSVEERDATLPDIQQMLAQLSVDDGDEGLSDVPTADHTQEHPR